MKLTNKTKQNAKDIQEPTGEANMILLAITLISVLANLYILLKEASGAKDVLTCIFIGCITGMCMPLFSCLMLYAIFKN